MCIFLGSSGCSLVQKSPIATLYYEVHVKGNHADGDKYLLKKSYQGIFRCRAGVGGQGSHEAMESPQALIAPLKRGSGELR